MPRIALPHNRLSGVTVDVWRDGDVVHKRLGNGTSPHAAHWTASDDPRHWRTSIRRPTGEVVFLDWAFTGDGALGEDLANLVPDSILDLHLPAAQLEELAERAEAAYLAGLREAGWDGDARLVALGVRTGIVKYDWLGVWCLEHAADEQLDDGGRDPVDADARYAARPAGLALCARWADEADDLASASGL